MMKGFGNRFGNRWTAALLLIATLTSAFAQGGDAASGPKTGGGPMHGMRFGPQSTPGWNLMTPEERNEHRAKMMAMTDYAECTSYMEQHHAQMAERAKQKGVAVPPTPRRDPCLPLKK